MLAIIRPGCRLIVVAKHKQRLRSVVYLRLLITIRLVRGLTLDKLRVRRGN
jgi:hypothetical protein